VRKAIKKHPIASFLVIISFVLLAVYIYVLKFTLRSTDGVSIALGDKIAVIEITGILLDSKDVIEGIQTAKENKNIKALVVRINSPGGGVSPSQDIYAELIKLKKSKNIVASLSSIAASGGYYVACAADKIVASPGSLTGSIGVVMNFSNMETLFDKIGLKNYVVKSGKYKDIGSPHRDMTASEKNLLQSVIDNVHEQFIGVVTAARSLPKDEVVKIADGRIFSGEQALNLGLVDKLGNLEDSILLAAEMSGIKGEPKVVYLKKKKGIVEYLFNRAGINYFKNYSLTPLMPQLMYASEFL